VGLSERALAVATFNIGLVPVPISIYSHGFGQNAGCDPAINRSIDNAVPLPQST
jgi:hypothetical protein